MGLDWWDEKGNTFRGKGIGGILFDLGFEEAADSCYGEIDESNHPRVFEHNELDSFPRLTPRQKAILLDTITMILDRKKTTDEKELHFLEEGLGFLSDSNVVACDF
jgi:hypothetical protein